MYICGEIHFSKTDRENINNRDSRLRGKHEHFIVELKLQIDKLCPHFPGANFDKDLDRYDELQIQAMRYIINFYRAIDTDEVAAQNEDF